MFTDMMMHSWEIASIASFYLPAEVKNISDNNKKRKEKKNKLYVEICMKF
jgi:hypothetical protein